MDTRDSKAEPTLEEMLLGLVFVIIKARFDKIEEESLPKTTEMFAQAFELLDGIATLVVTEEMREQLADLLTDYRSERRAARPELAGDVELTDAQIEFIESLAVEQDLDESDAFAAAVTTLQEWVVKVEAESQLTCRLLEIGAQQILRRIYERNDLDEPPADQLVAIATLSRDLARD